MKYAWGENNVIRDVCQGNPSECYHPSIAAYYTTEVADDVQNGWIKQGNGWVAPPAPTPPTPEPVTLVPPAVSPVEFMLLFTPQERVAIKATRSSDPVISDFFDIVDDPRLTQVNLALTSTQDCLDYLIFKGLLAAERKAEIITGVIA